MPEGMARGLGYDADGNNQSLLAERDREEIDRGIPRAAGTATCGKCGLELRLHPPVQGALWLTRTCEGIVKL